MELLSRVLIIPALTAPLLLLVAFIMKQYPPKKINRVYGYRTKSSMQSPERWDFAQIYSIDELIKWSTIMCLSSLIGLLYNFNEGMQVVIGLILVFGFLAIPIIKTERALKEKFG